MDRVRVRRLRTDELTGEERDAIRALLDAAFWSEDPGERFGDDDWAHALGGVHAVLDVGGRIAAHAAVVARELRIGRPGRALRTGYVEAVGVTPALQGRGYGTAVMELVDREIQDRFEIGALGTGAHGFYERLGWRTWQGPSSVRLPGGGARRTPDDDGFILVLPTPQSPALDLAAPISCEWRRGDAW